MQVIIRGAEEVIARLDTAALGLAVDRSLREASLRMVGELARYPSPPSGSTYRRTGTLGRAWTQQGAGLRYVVGNNVRYATYVQGPDQAQMHRGRWLTADKAAEEVMEPLTRDIAAAVAEAFD